MKLSILAIAIAATSMIGAAQADLKVGGDVGLQWGKTDTSNNVTTLEAFGSEVNLDASKKMGGLTGYGHAEIELNSNDADSADITVDELRVGVKGAFGDLTVGDTGSACDQLLVGGSSEISLTHQSGGCLDSSSDKIVYQRAMGATSIAVSHAPDEDYNAIAVTGKIAGVSAALAYEDEDGNDQVTLGLSAPVGPVTINFRANDNDSVSVEGYYSVGQHSVYGGIADNDGTNPISLGYTRTIANTDFFVEVLDNDDALDVNTAIGIRHNF